MACARYTAFGLLAALFLSTTLVCGPTRSTPPVGAGASQAVNSPQAVSSPQASGGGNADRTSAVDSCLLGVWESTSERSAAPSSGLVGERVTFLMSQRPDPDTQRSYYDIRVDESRATPLKLILGDGSTYTTTFTGSHKATGTSSATEPPEPGKRLNVILKNPEDLAELFVTATLSTGQVVDDGYGHPIVNYWLGQLPFGRSNAASSYWPLFATLSELEVVLLAYQLVYLCSNDTLEMHFHQGPDLHGSYDIDLYYKRIR